MNENYTKLSVIAGGVVKRMQRRNKEIKSSDCEARGKDTGTGVGSRSSNEGGGKEREERKVSFS